jgi:aquaporin Z
MALYLVVERPYSGMSMNPARTLGLADKTPCEPRNIECFQGLTATPGEFCPEALSFRGARPDLDGLWLYVTAPLVGMVLAGELYLLSFGRVYCAKLHHDNDKR